MASPSSRRATKRRRSSITELAFRGIEPSRLQKSEKCNPCVRYEMSPMSQAAQLSVRRKARLPRMTGAIALPSSRALRDLIEKSGDAADTSIADDGEIRALDRA